MAEVTSDATAPATSAGSKGTFVQRELNGASFLSLEHFLHMALVVIVAGLVAVGLSSAISMWTGGAGTTSLTMFGAPASSLLSGYGGGFKSLEALGALSIVAALLLLVPLLVVLDRRTRAEWTKRVGYSKRLAYRLPIYGALALLLTGKIVAEISMIAVVLQSIAYIGVATEDIGNMYLTQFVPALVTAVVFAGAGMYVFKLAKGQDMGRMFSGLVAVVGVVLAIALFITAYLVLHSPANNGYDLPFESSPTTRSLEDIFKY
jgi:hypothetical protein